MLFMIPMSPSRRDSGRPLRQPQGAGRLVGSAWLLAGLTLCPTRAATAGVVQVSAGTQTGGIAQLNSAGQLVWVSGHDLFLWSDGRTRQLTDASNYADAYYVD